MTGEPTQYLFIFHKKVSALLQEKANVKITHYYTLYYKKKFISDGQQFHQHQQEYTTASHSVS